MLDSLKYKILWLRLKQRLFGAKLDIEESWRNTPKEFRDMVGFLNWFDVTTSVESTINKAKEDWHYRFKSHAVFDKINHHKALEIGFGGGRLLMQASNDFDEVIGVDIHNNFDMSDLFLRNNGVENFKLINKTELDSIENSSIDLIYSFIVFQHFGSLEEVQFYLDQIERLLASNGVSIIYYGKNSEMGVELRTSDNFRLRDCSLFIHPEEMRKIIDKKFEILDYKDELPRDAVKNLGNSVQSMIVFKNKAHNANL